MRQATRSVDATDRRFDGRRTAALLQRERERYERTTSASRDRHDAAREHLAGGVGSSYQMLQPWPLHLVRGLGSHVWDVDGTARIDVHAGFGAMVQGHAHPAIAQAVSASMLRGTHLGAPCDDAHAVAAELARRWQLPLWRFTTSGSEATMDALRIARAFTGRDLVMKVLGSYHGHHDALLIGLDDLGDPPSSGFWDDCVPYGRGIPGAISDLTVGVPFNDAAALGTALETLAAQDRLPACLIMEPTMMLGMTVPEPGYLEAARAATARHGVVLIFDEVKTGLSVGPAGATGRYGVRPDVVTLAKTLGGGVPSGAIGATRELMELVVRGKVHQVGTFNGNPLSMSAARANLDEVLTDRAFGALERRSARLADACARALRASDLPGYALSEGARGCFTLAPERIVDVRTFARQRDARLDALAWFFQVNRGVYGTPARPWQWTLSVAHTDADVDRYVAVVEELADALAACHVN